MKILFLTPYPQGTAPSQRFRFELFFKAIEEKGWKRKTFSFLNEKGWSGLYAGNTKSRALSIISGFLQRILHVTSTLEADYIFIHRELTPLGPPIFEFLISKILRKKIIYDFDDAIWLPDPNEKSRLWQVLKWKSKVKWICKWSYKVSVGNEYLAAYARQFNERVIVVPTVVDTFRHQPINKKINSGKKRLTLGWTGSHSTLQYLKPIIPILQRLEREYDFEFLVIANKDPKLSLENFRFTKWNQEGEVKDLQEMDIGLMPLTDDEWSKGKCGFKAIQYGAIGIPSLVSPVGVNSEIVLDLQTGFLCDSDKKWQKNLSELLTNEGQRLELGKNARAHIQKNYSVEAVKEKFLNLFE